MKLKGFVHIALQEKFYEYPHLIKLNKSKIICIFIIYREKEIVDLINVYSNTFFNQIFDLIISYTNVFYNTPGMDTSIIHAIEMKYFDATSYE